MVYAFCRLLRGIPYHCGTFRVKKTPFVITGCTKQTHRKKCHALVLNLSKRQNSSLLCAQAQEDQPPPKSCVRFWHCFKLCDEDGAPYDLI